MVLEKKELPAKFESDEYQILLVQKNIKQFWTNPLLTIPMVC